MSNVLPFGESLPGSGNMYLRVKEKGDKVQFRLGQVPAYVGKHFMQKETGWEVTECLRIKNAEECDTCNVYFQMMANAKKIEKIDEKEFKKLKEDARHFQAAIEFYFPILNRITGKFAILQTTYGVRNQFNVQFEAGIDVMNKEWILLNTGSPSPAKRYSLTVVDSADVKPLTPEEETEFEKAKQYDLSQIGPITTPE